MRRRIVAAVASVVALGVLPIGTAASRADEPALGSYGGDARGTGVHVLSYSNGLTNFATGFVDNSYPLASTHMDAAPATQAVASVVDTGPLGATGTSQAKPQVFAISPQLADLVEQPQYATASYPGQASASRSQGGSVAEASAGQNNADANAAAAGGSADEANSNVRVDQAAGKVLANATGHVNHVGFDSGLLVIAGVDVRASVTIEGSKVTPHYEIAVESATVNGMPVMITDKGVVVQDPVPGSDAATQAINGQLNQALAGAALSVYVTAPKVTMNGAQATVEVSGVHVSYVAPQPDPSVPTFTYDFILGEARAFAFAVGAESTDESVSASGSDELVSAGELPSDLGSVSGAVTPLVPETGTISRQTGGAERNLTALPVSLRRKRPTWLVPIYLIWQALVLATGGALLWSRREDHG